MDRHQNPATRRRWADIAVIVAGAYALAAATQVPVELATGDVEEAVRFRLWLPAAYALGGVIGLASVFVAIRSTVLARVVLGAAVAMLVSGLFTLNQFAVLPLISLGMPALIMLVALPFMGPMPGPDEEAREGRATP